MWILAVSYTHLDEYKRQVQAYNPYSETELFSCDHLKRYENPHTMGWSFEENALYGYLNPEIEKGKNVDYNQYKDEEECVGISVKLNAPQEILSIGQKDHLKYKEQHVYPWQVSMNEAYACLLYTSRCV